MSATLRVEVLCEGCDASANATARVTGREEIYVETPPGWTEVITGKTCPTCTARRRAPPPKAAP